MNANGIDNRELTSELVKGEQLMKTENLKANRINGIPHFRIVIGVLVVLVTGCFLFFGGCEKRKHAILMIEFVQRGDEKPDTDVVLVKNTLEIGGLLRCGNDDVYIEKIQSIDKTIKDCCAKDSEDKYYIRPSILNWISSKGWKFQERFADRYYFIK